MRLICTFFVFILFVNTSKLCAQAPAIQWQKNFGGANNELAVSIQLTADGGYITGGTTSSVNGDVSGNHGGSDFWLVKLNSTGNLMWQKTYGGSNDETMNALTQTADGGYIMVGKTFSNNGDVVENSGGADFFIVKVNSTGVIDWKKTIGGAKDDVANTVQQTADGGYIIAGESGSTDGYVTNHHGSNTVADCWIIKLDANGVLEWEQSYGGSLPDIAYSIKQIADGSYIMAGSTKSNDFDVSGHHGTTTVFDFWIVKLSSTGAIQWQKSLGGTNNEDARAIIQTPEGGYLAVGQGASVDGDMAGNPSAHNGFWIVKISSAGNIEWQKCYGGNSTSLANCVALTSDENYLVGGYSFLGNADVTGGHGTFDYWILQLDKTGNIQWQKSLGGVANDFATALQSTPDAGLIVAGSSSSSDGEVTANNGGSDIWVVKLGPIPCTTSISITATPATTVCFGTPVTFMATINTNVIAPVYQWKKNGLPVGTNSSTYTDASLNNNDEIYCVLTNVSCFSNPTAQSNSVFAKIVTGQPQITISTAVTTICSNATPVFSASVTNGSGTPNYQWKINGVNAGTNSSGFAPSNLPDGAKITCVYTDNSPCTPAAGVISNEIQMEVMPMLTPTISVSADDNNICQGKLITFTANASQPRTGAAQSFQWKLNGNPVGVNSNTYQNSTLNNGDKIICTLTDNSTCTTQSVVVSNTITMIVNSSSAPSVNIAATSANICSGTKVTFTAAVINAGPGIIYQWKKNNANVGLNQNTYNDASLQNNDVIICVIMPAGCSSSPNVLSNQIVMKVSTGLPVISITGTAGAVCSGADATFISTVSNIVGTPNYQWRINNVNAGTNSNTFSSTSLKEGDVITCVITDNSPCTPTGGIISNSITAHITTPLDPTISISASDNNICENKSVTFTAAASQPASGYTQSFQWKINGINVGVNSVLFTTANLKNNDVVTCTLTDNSPCVTVSFKTSQGITMVVTPIVNPAITITVSENNICENIPVTFKASVQNAGSNPTFQWIKNNVNVGGNNNFYIDPSPAEGDKIYCKIISNAACTLNAQASSNEIIMHVSKIAQSAVSIAASALQVCAGAPVTFIPTPTNGGAAPQFLWKVNNGFKSSAQTFTTTSLKNGDEIICEITSSLSCTSPAESLPIKISVEEKPVIIPRSDTTIFEGAKVLLNTAVTGNIISYNWAPANSLSQNNILSPVAMPQETTIYTLQVTTALGCTTSAQIKIRVIVNIKIANTFTPNNDGINDVWNIGGLDKFEGCNVQIFNRYGQQVFKSLGYNTPWNGTYKGKGLPVGAYYYVITFKDAVPAKTGFVTILK